MALDIERLIAEIDADPAKAIAALEAFKRAQDSAARDRTAHIDVDVDRSSLDRAEGALGTLGRGGSELIDTLGGLTDSLQSVGGAAGGVGGGFRTALGGMSGFRGGIGGIVMSLVKFGFTLAGIMSMLNILPGLLASVAGAAGILTAALAPLLGLLGAIPVGLGAIGGGVAATVVGFMGIGDALSAMGKKADDATPLLDTINQRARQVAMAERGLRDAHRAAAEAAEALTLAQKGLNEAREAAKEDLQQQRFTVRQAILSEKQAVLALKNAQERLNDAQKKVGDSTKTITQETDYFTGKVYEVTKLSADAADQADNEAEARLAVQQAELNLAIARDRSKDAQKELTEMERKGIKGSDQVVAARERIEDAQWSYKKALEGIKDAEYNLAQARKDATEAINKESAATTALRDAMARLTPAGKAFVRFLHDEFLPAWDQVRRQVQERLLPGIQRGLRRVMGTFDLWGDRLGDFAETTGTAFDDFWKHWTAPQQVKRLDDMFKGLNETWGNLLGLGTPLTDVIIGITEAAKPMTDRIIAGLNKELTTLGNWLRSDEGKEKATKFFEDAAHFGGLWWDAMKGMGGILKAIVRAASPLAEEWLSTAGTNMQSLADSMNSVRGQKKLKKFFEDQIPTLKEFWKAIKGIADVFFNSSAGGEDSGFYKFLKEMNDNFLPAFKENVKDLDASEIAKDFLELGTSLSRLADSLDAIAKTSEGLEKFLNVITKISDVIGKIHGFGTDDSDPWWQKLIVGNVDPTGDSGSLFDDLVGGLETGYSKVDGWFQEHMAGDNAIGGKLRRLFGIDDNKQEVKKGLPAMSKMITGWSGPREWGTKLAEMSSKWKTNFDNMKLGWDTFKSTHSESLKMWWDTNVSQKWNSIRDGMSQRFSDGISSIKEKWRGFKEWWNEVKENFTVSGLFDWLGRLFDDALADLKQSWNDFWEDIPTPSVPKIDLTPWDGLMPSMPGNPFKWSGGPVDKDSSYIVGEKGPELFTPSSSGRIMPANPTREYLHNSPAGMSSADIDRLVRAIESQRQVTIDQTFNEKIDPMHVAREVAWRVA